MLYCFIYTSLVSALIFFRVSTATRDGSYLNCSVLYLLNVEPYPDHSKTSGVDVWDRGLDLVPAGHLAVEQINNRSDILQGYELKLIDIDSEACGRNLITKGIVNVFKELVNHTHRECIVGLVGLFCSSVTDAVSTIVSHPDIGGYVQIAASTSPVHRKSTPSQTHSNLFHIIESSSVINEGTFALMRAFRWNRISIVYNSVKFYFRSMADDFMNKINKVELVTQVPLTDSSSRISEAFSTINEKEARISYWIVDAKQTAHLLCEAFRKRFRWPGHIFIINDLKMGEVLDTKTSCSREDIMSALEGVFTLQYRLFVDNNTRLFSGLAYREYQQMYADKLKKFASERPDQDIRENIYANSLYDQVWAFGLAINNSNSSIDSQILGYEDKEKRLTMSDVLRIKLRELSFQGASGG